MPSKEYLEAILEKVKETLTPAEWQELNRAAIPKSGGRASWSSASGRFKLGDLRGDFLQSASDEELKQIWSRLEKWHERTDDKEPFERAASFVLQELQARDLLPEQGPLEQGARKMSSLSKRVDSLADVVIVERGSVKLTRNVALAVTSSVVPAVAKKAVAFAGIDLPVMHCDSCNLDDSLLVYDLALVRSVAMPEGNLVSKSAGDWLVEMGITSTEPEGVDLGAAISVAKSDDEKQITYYVVSEPDSLDAHGERISAETIEEALHKYIASAERALKLEHDKPIDGRAVVVEGFLAPCDLEKFHGQTPGCGTIKAGSSIVAIHYTDKALWNELKNSEHGISWGGEAKRVKR